MMESAFHRAGLAGLLLAHLAMVPAALTSTLRVPAWPLVLAQLLLVGWIAVTLLRSRRAVAPLLANYVMGAAGLVVAAESTSALAFGGVWILCISAATPRFLLPLGKAVATSLAAIVTLAVALIVAHPDWPAEIGLTAVVTAVALDASAHVIIAVMRRAAGRVEHEARREEQALQRARVVRTASRQIAEDARLLHDTLVNTLGAIAAGGGVHDDAMVRARCAEDLRMASSLVASDDGDRRDSATTAGSMAETPSMADLANATEGIVVDFTGPPRSGLQRYESLVPPAVLVAMHRAATEAIRNAHKHSGCDTVEVRVVASGEELVVSVEDQGVGFAGVPLDGHGLAMSVVDRCREVGVTPTIRSAPGMGTEVSLSWSMGRELAREPDNSRDDTPALDVDAIYRVGCWAWAAGVLGTAIVTALPIDHHPPHLSLWAIVLTTALCGAAWWIGRHGPRLTGWIVPVIVVAVPIVFSLSFLGGLHRPAPLITTQAMVITPLLMILLLARTQLPLIISLSLLGTAVALFTLGLVPDHAALPIVAAVPQMVLLGCWIVFLPTIREIGRRHAEHRQRAMEVEVRGAAQEALMRARSRWTAAGVRHSMELLQGLADGSRSAQDPLVQQECGQGETYLRAMLSIDPDLVHLGQWLALALVRARERSISLSFRGGTIDAADAASAERLGRLLLEVIARSPEGCELVVGMFNRAGSPLFTLVGPAGLMDAVGPFEAPTGFTVHSSIHGDHWRVELRPTDRQPQSV